MFFVFFFFIITAEARVYAYIEKNGMFHNLSKTHFYTNLQSNDHKKSKEFVRFPNISNRYEIDYCNNCSLTHSVNELIQTAAAENRIDPLLIKAVIKAESNFNRKAVSAKGAQGLMQLMPQTARDLHVLHPFDPEENITGGAKYLRSLLDNYDGAIELTLAAYNAGPGNVKDHLPDIPETKQYVSKVISHYKKYQQKTN